MLVQAVDLASRLSAVCLLGPGREVVSEFGSMHCSEFQFLEGVSSWFLEGVSSWTRLGVINSRPDVVVVEDVPHHMRFDTTTKAVVRIQGRIIDRFAGLAALDRLLFIPPALWQRHFPGVWRQGEKGAAAAAEVYGYRPPQLLDMYKHLYECLGGKERQKVRVTLKKQMSDYVDAFLIAVWAQEVYEAKGTLDVPSAQWYLPYPDTYLGRSKVSVGGGEGVASV